MNCPKCDQDVSDSFEPDDPSVGIVAGWYCDSCELAIGDDGVRHEPQPDDVPIMSAKEVRGDRPLGTPLSEISGRPGHEGYSKFVRIARSWGYE